MSSLPEIALRLLRWRRIAGVVAAGLFAALSPVPALQAAAPAGVDVGDAFPSLAMTGAPAAELPSLAGRVVLVDFWASWCAPCKASFRSFAALHRDLADAGLLIVAVGVDEKPDAYAAFVRRHEPPFATIHDRERALVRRLRIPAMPTTFLLDRAGRVRFVHAGFTGKETEEILRQEIARLLAEKE